MTPLIIKCPVCNALKAAGEPCANCKEQAKRLNDKERARLEHERKQSGQQKHGRSEE